MKLALAFLIAFGSIAQADKLVARYGGHVVLSAEPIPEADAELAPFVKAHLSKTRRYTLPAGQVHLVAFLSKDYGKEAVTFRAGTIVSRAPTRGRRVFMTIDTKDLEPGKTYEVTMTLGKAVLADGTLRLTLPSREGG